MGDRHWEDIKKKPIMDCEKDKRQKEGEAGGKRGAKHDVIRIKSGS